ncbi:MAG: transposase [Tritonibacter mobilis]|nr:transposase [Tritonibacter mobilis]
MACQEASGVGHDGRIIPAQFVKLYVKSHKNDIIDAEAIAEAATRPTMRFVGIKEAHQVDLQMLHRVRSRLVKGQTNLICQMRSYCLEHGVALRQGAGIFKLDIVRASCRKTFSVLKNGSSASRPRLRTSRTGTKLRAGL